MNLGVSALIIGGEIGLLTIPCVRNLAFYEESVNYIKKDSKIALKIRGIVISIIVSSNIMVLGLPRLVNTYILKMQVQNFLEYIFVMFFLVGFQKIIIQWLLLNAMFNAIITSFVVTYFVETFPYVLGIFSIYKCCTA